MNQYLVVHPTHPQRRLVALAVQSLRKGGVIAWPTDTTYALGCRIGDKTALDRIRAIRRLADDHQFTMTCRDLSELSVYARVDNTSFRILKHYTPGPFTFLLPATRETPKRLVHPKRKTIGLRVPYTPIAQTLLEELGEPMMTTTLRLAGAELPLRDPEDIRDQLGHAVDVVLDGGHGGAEFTTVVDLTGAVPEVVRQGVGVFE